MVASELIKSLMMIGLKKRKFDKTEKPFGLQDDEKTDKIDNN